MNRQRGFTLIEVLVAVSVIGLASVALFSLFSTSLLNLRKLQDLHHYQLACEDLMNRVQLLQKLPARGNATGRLSDLGADWNVTVAPWYPASLDSTPDQAIMKVDVNMIWRTRAGQRSFHIESLKPATIVYNSYDLSQAIDHAAPR
jgi:general secretion pathway protein I